MLNFSDAFMPWRLSSYSHNLFPLNLKCSQDMKKPEGKVKEMERAIQDLETKKRQEDEKLERERERCQVFFCVIFISSSSSGTSIKNRSSRTF